MVAVVMTTETPLLKSLDIEAERPFAISTDRGLHRQSAAEIRRLLEIIERAHDELMLRSDVRDHPCAVILAEATEQP